MQRVTPDAGLDSALARVKLSHRAALAVMAILFMYAAGATVYNDTEPRPIDFLVQFALFIVLALSAVRHSMVTRYPHVKTFR